ncbi:endonuclease III domain-containing protein [Bombilactobacillus bombi]|uniref:endonuclease III domain-containing protein n=1 Tax=Bombilactobacillus bombi TaxID=1303590 RepID=UPI0015E617C3|nr:endonuclease III [Bombilactobacillus bombi]
MLNNQQIKQAFQLIIAEFPQAGPSLQAESNFQYLIAVILSAQTTDKAVNLVTPQLFKKYPTAQAMAQASISDIEPLIKSIGLYHNKARYLQACAQKLNENFAGVVPAVKTQLVTLPGVGTKTANVVLADCFGIPAFAVDTHVSTIAKRLHFVEPKANVQQIEHRITTALPQQFWIKGHHALIMMGRKYNFHNESQIKDLPVVQQCDLWEMENNPQD